MVTSQTESADSSFADLGIRTELLATLSALGYEEATPIQSAAIPVLITGRDLLGQAATGTGKTAAFALPILERLADGDRGKAPSSLVLVPTRELALQVSQAFHGYGRGIGARLVAIYGGAPARHQVDALRRGVDVVVATPGRALDLCSRGDLVLGSIRTLVLDEADEMLEMGFIEDIESIIAMTPESRQTVLFSATMPKRIDKLAERHLRDPQRISIRSREAAHDEVPRVRQVAYVVTRQNKAAALGRVLDAEDPTAAIVFCRTRGGVDDLSDLLTARGYQAEALHGGLTQEQRTRVLGRLRSGATELLVATDVAARGLDIDLLSHVVNYDLPMSPESYVHRIGRVGRAGREGVALSLVEPRERRMLTAIEKLVGGRIPVEQVPTVTDVRQMRQQRTRDAVEALLDDPDAQIAPRLRTARSWTRCCSAGMRPRSRWPRSPSCTRRRSGSCHRGARPRSHRVAGARVVRRPQQEEAGSTVRTDDEALRLAGPQGRHHPGRPGRRHHGRGRAEGPGASGRSPSTRCSPSWRFPRPWRARSSRACSTRRSGVGR